MEKCTRGALTAQTPYAYVITDLVDNGTAQGSFTTDTPKSGNLYPEQPQFSSNGWDNRAYPQFDWTPQQRGQMLTDPTTGMLVKRVTFASDGYDYSEYSGDTNLPQLANGVFTGGSCAGAGNLNTNGSGFATCSGAATVFMPLPAFQMSGDGTFNNWYPRFNLDDLILYLYGTADAASARAHNGSDTVAVCLAQGANLP